MLFEDKFQEWKSNSVKLTENFRCSSSICDFISKFSHTNFVSKNNDNLLEIKPEFKTYADEMEINGIIKKFLLYCDSKNIEKNDNSRAILFRGQDFAKKFGKNGLRFNIYKIFKGNDLEHTFTRFLVLGKYEWDLGFKSESFKLLEKAFLMLEEKVDFVNRDIIKLSIENKGFLKHRKDILDFINRLPEVNADGDINTWIDYINDNFDFEIRLKKTSNVDDSNFNGLFDDIQLDLDESINYCHFGTIHSVKGKSFRAVLLILKERPPRKKKYSKLFKKYDLLKEEELRIPYVAMTRAKEILWIVIPKTEKRAWIRKASSNASSRSIQQTLF